jgi:phage terminase large subunit GpA-like protein
MTTSQPPPFNQVWRHVFDELRASVRRAVGKGLEALKTPEPLTGDEWANRHFYLSAESSQGEKRWESYPFQRVLLCAMGDDDIQEVDLRKSARVGYTKMLLALVLYNAHHKRRNQCLWQPTDNDSDEFCKAELEPAIRDVKVMADVFPQFMAKSKANTLNMKKFLGSLLYLKGGTSAGNYRRMTLQCALLDEFDQFDQKIEKSADPFTLAHKRLEGATYPKIICGTTPRIKGLSHIEKRELSADARMRFVVECPHCEVEHPLMWGGKDSKHGIKWDHHDPEGTAHHVCPHCHGKMTQDQYLRIADRGCWVSECGNFRAVHRPEYHWTDGEGSRLLKPPRHVAFHVWTAYSPQTTWGEIVRQFLQCVRSAKGGDKAPLEGFVNETLGETWEDEVEKADTHALMSRAEKYPLRVVPAGGLELVAGVDTQDKWWAVGIWAVGRGEEMWMVDYQEIEGNPADERDWAKVHHYLQQPLQHISGAPMKVQAVAIDTGGHFTHQAYNFCREHQGQRYYAVKGDSQDGKPIKGRSSSQDVNWRGRVIKAGVKLWMVGTDTAKDLFFGRLKVTQPGPGYVHFSQGLDSKFFKGLTSEVRKQIRTSTGLKYRWVKVETRNEPLDTAVYALFASQMRDHYKMTDAQWSRLENDLRPDLFGVPFAQAGATQAQLLPPETPPAAGLVDAAHIEVRDPVTAPTRPSATPPEHSPQPKPRKPKPASSFASSEWMSRL